MSSYVSGAPWRSPAASHSLTAQVARCAKHKRALEATLRHSAALFERCPMVRATGNLQRREFDEPNFAAIALPLACWALPAGGWRPRAINRRQSGTGNSMANRRRPCIATVGHQSGMAATQMSPQQFALTAVPPQVRGYRGELALARHAIQSEDFARMMVKDHTVALQELQAAAKAANIVLPPDIALDAMHQAKINAIRNRKGADFDQAYRIDQVQAHQQTIAILDTYATAGGNSALKAWAAKALPMVRKHFDHLQALGMGSGSR